MKITRNQDIDRMRGLTVFLMLVVNSPVDLRITNSALIHSEWAGLSLADTVFPTFLFIVGISLTLSNRLKKITLRGLFIRSTVLVLTGIFLKAIVFVLYDQEHFKIMGVLQRIYFSIPIVKKLWTPSFLLICVGIAIWLYLLVKRMAVIDLTWLEYPGKHSLAIYVISVIAFDVLLYCHVWHSLFVAVYTWLIPRSIPLQGATLFFSVLFSSVICFTPYLIQKTMFFVKRAI
ncbi:TPA: heparan-alpha-glucosaminide N-acetyltransferase domain-containing protein [Klebsiella oxytoca]|uniref:heparan-alpha-glucosaminide N-acetyltransferase domain-containing protein n=1 Tax=Klebsiella oxytoca TaxID=571 RepID=UPI00190ED4A0|nr:heparan-alpha-glucosaminide N-acetyltransferase domain-containing protein [Klebsiella oxytoca]MCW9633751.1 heparan-alpha-glucosaminide N-acetyltransferase domain-containing protein [Klebsiella oxytoca]